MRFAACALLMLANIQSAQAGRPIETDDASAAEFRTCQLDFWTESSRELRRHNFNGGCNLLGQGEFSLGLGRVHGNQEDQLLSSLGYKHIFQDFTSDSPGFGLAASREWGRLKSTDESSQETLLTTIASVPLRGEDLLLHLNLGYLQYSDQIQSDNSVFKAAALDYSLNERIGFSVETYSGVEDALSWRIGARYTLIPDFLQIDASYGSDYGTFQNARAFTLGFGITPGF
ncbi:hypothetical protein [Limnobacter sp. MED105]|uniref:hypothetical protein n=1 Tax=Limnobacter sp. MED105 TaxID=391597 RepID=UPI000156C441|nr:hypothetical protein [Limnobacter sp. MED105]EDM82974.1 hypothetical protein LMED105_11830 [Limnobacter sp. MED105]